MRKQKISLNQQAGFSLIEVMVVVAIVSIIVAVSVSSYSKYAFKSRDVEAKSNLGGLFASEVVFFSNFGLYHTSFQALGYAPEGRVHYNVGFGEIGVVAGPGQGFDLPVNLNAISSKEYCAGIGGANVPGNRCSMVNMTPDIHWVFTAYPSGGFTAAAIIDSTLYVQNEFENSKPRLTGIALFMNALLGADLAHALAATYSRPDLDVRHHVWVIDERKNLRKISN